MSAESFIWAWGAGVFIVSILLIALAWGQTKYDNRHYRRLKQAADEAAAAHREASGKHPVK